MGFFSGLFKAEGNELATGSHAINHQTIMGATSSDVITPLNPGSFASIRSTPVVPDVRYFSEEEAQALRTLADEKEQGVRHTKKAYKALVRVEKSDLEVHRAHRKYQGKVADVEVAKKRSDAKLGRHLHSLRPEYTRIQGSLERAESKADKRIEAIRSKVREALA